VAKLVMKCVVISFCHTFAQSDNFNGAEREVLPVVPSIPVTSAVLRNKVPIIEGWGLGRDVPLPMG